jgi:hypothetical protein
VFLGHYGIAFAAKRASPRTSLGTFVFAGEFLDELWPVLLLLGIEQVRIVPGLMSMSPLLFVHYPWSHSLLMAIAWGMLIAALYYSLRKWIYVAVLAILYVASNGAPPPSVSALAWTTMGMWLFIPWAWWIDKHRVLLPLSWQQENSAPTPLSPV